jgi:hypothetical protein
MIRAIGLLGLAQAFDPHILLAIKRLVKVSSETRGGSCFKNRSKISLSRNSIGLKGCIVIILSLNSTFSKVKTAFIIMPDELLN